MKNIHFYRILICCAIFALTNEGSILAQGLGEIDGTLEIKMNSTTGSPHLRLFEDDTSFGGSTRIELRHRDDGGDNFEIRSFLDATINQRIGWYFNGSNRVVWNEGLSGLGIGTENPSEKLEVVVTGNDGILIDGNNSGDARYSIENGGGTHYLFDDSSNANTLKLESANALAFNTNGINERMRITDSGDIAIGTIIPDEKLHVQVTGNDGIKIEGDGTGDARLWFNNTAGSHYLFDDDSDGNAFKISSANDFAINAGGSQRLHIRENNGEIGINTDGNANYRLFVDNTSDLFGLFVRNAGGQRTGILGSVISTGASTATGVRGTVSGTSSSTRKGVEGSSSTTPANSWAVYADGDFWYTGTLKAPSDIRLKKNIENLNPVLDKVMQLETKTYEFKKDEYDFVNLANGPQIGFIAQNVQELFPTLVEEETHTFQVGIDQENGIILEESIDILGMSSIEMIPILTKAIQEQQVLINELRTEMEELKSEKK